LKCRRSPGVFAPPEVDDIVLCTGQGPSKRLGKAERVLQKRGYVGPLHVHQDHPEKGRRRPQKAPLLSTKQRIWRKNGKGKSTTSEPGVDLPPRRLLTSHYILPPGEVQCCHRANHGDDFNVTELTEFVDNLHAHLLAAGILTHLCYTHGIQVYTRVHPVHPDVSPHVWRSRLNPKRT